MSDKYQPLEVILLSGLWAKQLRFSSLSDQHCSCTGVDHDDITKEKVNPKETGDKLLGNIEIIRCTW